MHPDLTPELVAHLARLAASYRHLTGGDLVSPGTPAEVARRIEEAPFAVLSHGTEPDPILNYGNRVARTLWQLEWHAFIRTPSRETAEAPDRQTRERLLEQVAEQGFMEGYSGVRISATGHRFVIEDVTIWNVTAADGRPAGQAAMFPRWRACEP